MLRINLILILFAANMLVMSSCISTKDLIKQNPTLPDKFSTNSFNGDYKNKCDSGSTGLTLWNALYFCKTFKQDTTKVTYKSIVNLIYDNKNKLIVTVRDDSVILNKIVLKVKLVGDYLSVKRNLFIVPIPFLSYYHEAKVALSIEKNQSLDVKYARSQFIWIIFAGGVDQKQNGKFNKIAP